MTQTVIAFLLGCGVGASFIIWAGRQYVLSLRQRWKSALALVEELDTDNGMRTRPSRSAIGPRYKRPSPEKMALMWAVMEKAPNINPNQRGRLHPNEKSVSLMRRLVSVTDGVVVDPFIGSGTTLRAAKDLGRRAVGIEIEERYCEIAAKRMGQEVFDLAA